MDESVDAVLMLGPLYHLTERGERIRALAEARRVLRPRAPVLAAGISRFAPAVDGLRKEFLLDSGFAAIVDRDLRDGQHRNPSRQPGWFTTAYVHHPAELGPEVAEAGFAEVEVFAVEGIGELLWMSSEPGSTTRPAASCCCAPCGDSSASRACSARPAICSPSAAPEEGARPGAAFSA